MMKSTRSILVVLIVAIIGCGGDDTSSPDNLAIADLIGTWHATKFEFISKANVHQKVDLVPLGAAYALVVLNMGDVIVTFNGPGDPPENQTGTAAIQDGKLFLDFDDTDDDVTAEFELSGALLTLLIDAAEYDFDDDGTDDPATVTLAMQKQNGRVGNKLQEPAIK